MAAAAKRSPTRSIQDRVMALQTQITNLQAAFHQFQQTFNSQTSEINKEICSLLLSVEGTDSSSPPPPKRPKAETDRSVAENGFKVDENGFVVVYTDGACLDNGKTGARAGCGVWWADGHGLNCSFPASRATNNAGEIGACTKAISIAGEKGVKKLKIVTDSQFTIDCVTKWMKNWKRNGWRLSGGGPVKNTEELKALDAALQKANLKITWQHVPGHKGIHGNEEADKLAREGALKYTQ